MLPSIQRDKQLTTIYTVGMTLWFSYETLVAFRINADKFVSENRWSAQTGRHLNQIDGGDKGSRLKKEVFERKWAELSRDHTGGLLG